MDPMDLEDATTELYSLTPSEFTARRTELAAEARSDGQADLAREIGQLRRPTVSAWLVNQLARGAGGGQEVDELEALGSELREAQAQLDGARMKELTRRRQHLVAALVKQAGTVAAQDGQKVSTAVQRELEETFGAAVADEQASLAVTSGRLTRALAYAGLGEVDLTSATATALTGPPRRLRPASASASASAVDRPKDGSGRRGGRVREADPSGPAPDPAAAAATQLREKHRQALEAVEQAGSDEAAAADDLAAATQRLGEVRARRADLTGRLEELQREIVRVRHELDGVERSIGAAERDVGRRERQLEQARKAGRDAQQALERS